MKIEINDQVLQEIADREIFRVVSEKIKSLFDTGYHVRQGVDIIGKILKEYLNTDEFKNKTIAIAEEIMIPTIKDVIKKYIEKITMEILKKSLPKDKIKPGELFDEKD